MGRQGHIWNRRFWTWVNTPEMREHWFIAKQLRAYHGGTYASSWGSGFFITLMAAVAWLKGALLLAAPGLAAFFAAAVVRHLRTRRFFRLEGAVAGSEELRWVSRHSIMSGAAVTVAAVFALILPLADVPGLAALLIVGMLLGGSWNIDVVPRAALSFLTVMAAGCIAGFLFLGTQEALIAAAITALYAFGFVAHCMFSFNSFAVRLLRAKEIERAADTVQLLLNDYEEHSADWLWEIGSTGRIRAPSARFAEVSRRTPCALESLRLIDLFDETHERAILERLLDKGQSFRDVVARLTLDGEECWWSLSGRAVINANGAVVGMRGVATDVSAAKRAEAQVAYMAHYDGLTDLPNRRLFNETLARALARRKDNYVGVLYLDIDHFKTINDTLGHGIGDEVLKIAAQRIEACLGHQDMVSRLGGDEFAVLLADCVSADDAAAIAEAIVAKMSEPVHVARQEIVTGISVGIALAPEHGSGPDELVKNADLALYHAKQAGRCRYAWFEIGMHEAMQARRMIETELRSALARNQLELHYQPLVNLESGEITSYEALLRWNHPERGTIMPSTFIPVAEESGYIVQLGEWVIRTALLEVARWPEHLSVSVNLSPAQMRSTNLVPAIVNALAASGVAPHRLELEITESVLMQDTQANLAVLHQLRELGVRIALDDFGTGYSSLNYLRSFPFDKIKIDRCFVDEIDSRDDSRAIVRAVTGLASNLGMVTTAEGVERADQLEELRREGCTEVQGYLLSRPVPVSEIEGRAAGAEPPARPPVEFKPAKRAALSKAAMRRGAA